MTIQQTIWSPDTCGCVLTYTWDDTVSDTQRVHTVSSTTKCPSHSAAFTDTVSHYNGIIDENQRKNLSLTNILDNGPTSLYDLQGTTKILKQGIDYVWSWSGTAPNRLLNVSFTGTTLTTAQKNSLQTALNTKFGTNKVKIT